MNLLPAFILRQIEHRPNLLKVVDNLGWLMIDNILRMGVGLLVGVWIARYLGPEQFGMLNFAMAFTGMFGAIAALGLQSIVVRDIVREPEGARVTLGTTAMLQLIGGFFAYLASLFSIAQIRPDDALARSIVAIVGSIMLLKGSDIATFWFESQVQSKYIVWVQNSVFLVFATIKVVLILQHAPLIAFVWATLGEAILVALILISVMSNVGLSLRGLRVSGSRARTLLNDSWPLILSAMAVAIYMKIDQIMLGQMIGDEAVGVYSAAIRISELWYFIPMAIGASVFPGILEAKKRSQEQYEARFQKLFDLMVVISVLVAVPMTFLSKPIIACIYGDAYLGADTILAIHIWAAVFVFLGAASGKWFLAESLQLLSLQRTALGAVTNIGLNLCLIPFYGAVGAALATVVSYAIAGFFADLIQQKTRKIFFMKVSSMNPIAVWRRQIDN